MLDKLPVPKKGTSFENGFDTPELRDALGNEEAKKITAIPPIETPQQKQGLVAAAREKVVRFFGQDLESILKKGEERIRTNPNVKSAYDMYLAQDGPEVAEKFKEALGRYTYIGRDEEGNFVDKTKYSVASGEGTSGK